MFDKLEKIENSLVQHGPNNNRVYLMKLGRQDLPGVITRLHELASSKGYTKIFAKVPDWAFYDFLKHDYQEEAVIQGFYKGKEAVHFMSLFYSPERSSIAPDLQRKIDENVKIALSKKTDGKKIVMPSGMQIRALGEKDAPQLAALYKEIFSVYPFPIFDEDYLKETMKAHIQYFGAFIDKKMVAASSAEIDREDLNAEMTDFATHPEFRGKNISCFLLEEMEKSMKEQGLKTLYTIARAHSPGINATFARSDYAYAGTLINNTQISEGIESMNIWYKNI